MSRKKNWRWFSTRLVGPIDAAAVEQQLDAEMKRQVAIAMHQGGNMHGTRLTIRTPEEDIVIEFPEMGVE